MLNKERVFDFLYGLNKDLDEIRGRVLGFKPFPNLKKASTEVRIEQSRCRVTILQFSSTPGFEQHTQESTLVTKKKFQNNGLEETRGTAMV